MDKITVLYDLKWEYVPIPYYQWTKCGKLFNTKTGRQLKKVYNSGSIGYWIAGKFITITNLRSNISKINPDMVSCQF